MGDTTIVLDLFSGTGSATAAFRERDGYKVTGVDIMRKPEKGVDPDIQADILELEPSDLPNADVVWASPPCISSSWANNGKDAPNYWDNNSKLPLEKESVKHVRLLYHALYLIGNLNPTWWFLENPQGRYNDWDMLPMPPKGRINYCMYGDERQKPTYLWGKHPQSFQYRICDLNHKHENQHLNTSSNNEIERSKVPRGLSEAILEAVENPGAIKQQTIENLL